VALRVPDAAIPRAVVERFGLPITATSANLQGASECTHAACVRDQLGDRIPTAVPPAAGSPPPSSISRRARDAGRFCARAPSPPTRLSWSCSGRMEVRS
jgi:tRNA A37 threonylcarbamoyladenosine synthetase subunit TsaC/SUA5/YrdC